MALDWQPHFPDQVPHRRLRIVGGSTPGPFTVQTNPPPDILASLTYRPTFPDQVPHRKSQVARTSWFNPPYTAALTPTGWQPTYPGQVPHRRLGAGRLPTLFEPPPGMQVVIAQSLAWQAKYPSQVGHTRPPNVGGTIESINPTAAASGLLCVELTPLDLTTPTLLDPILTVPGMLSPTLGTPSLTGGELC